MNKLKMHRDVILAGLDVGTSKICIVIGELNEEGELDVIGIGSHPSQGVRKGRIVDIERTCDGIHEAIREAELMAGCSIHEVFVNVSGSHVRSSNSSGIVPLSDRIVRDADIHHVLAAARAVPFDQHAKLLHILPQEFVIDEQDKIINPLGMSGVRMEARVHLITGSLSCIENITRCVQKSRRHPSALILNAIADSESLLHEDERDLGVAMVDIGAGTTDIAIFESKSIVHTIVLPVGGDQITNDIATSLSTPTQDAERLKIRHGCAKSGLLRHNEHFEVPGVAGRRPRKQSRLFLAEVIEPRVEEIFSLIVQEIRRCGCEGLLSSGLVLTGGCTNLEGFCEAAEEITGMPVKRGFPQQVGGLSDIVRSPIYSTSIGLLQHGLRLQQDPYLDPMAPPTSFLAKSRQQLHEMVQKVSRFFS
ncbi:MAG: cell division protein FtsA [Myxococcota bacterium]